MRKKEKGWKKEVKIKRNKLKEKESQKKIEIKKER